MMKKYYFTLQFYKQNLPKSQKNRRNYSP
jgi:hypothetical protein